MSDHLRRRATAMRNAPTKAEAAAWQMLRKSRTNGAKFRRQAVLGPYVVDFVCFDPRVIVEIDGGQHAVAARRDAARTAWLETQGYCVLRFWNHDVLANPEGVRDSIVAAIERPR
jgi:very-short-patch-repair endonuclease